MKSSDFVPIKKQNFLIPKPPIPYVQLQISTWIKESHCLYDYEANGDSFQIETYDLKKPVNIYCNLSSKCQISLDAKSFYQQILAVNKGSKAKDISIENIYVASLVFKEEQKSYYIQSADVSGIEPPAVFKEDHPNVFKNSYLVLRDYFTSPGIQGYPLKPGTILRLGRVEYLIIEVRNQLGTHTFKEMSHLKLNKEIYEAKQNSKGACKVCLSEQNSENDPLINPCYCKGSCQFIHVGCLKSWMSSRIKKQIVGIAATYNFSKLECEICKDLLPKFIKLLNGKLVQMISLDKPQQPYILLESFCDKDIKEEKKERNLYLLCPNQQCPIKIGRSNQCQIRLYDISVSRTHLEIRYEQGQFYAKDLKSKFGSLIKFREEFKLKDKLKIQYRRTCYEFRLIDKNISSKQHQYEEIPVFYTRGQLRQMGKLEDINDEDF